MFFEDASDEGVDRGLPPPPDEKDDPPVHQKRPRGA